MRAPPPGTGRRKRQGRGNVRATRMMIVLVGLWGWPPTETWAQSIPESSCIRFDDLSAGPAEASLPRDWSLRAVSGQDAPTAAVTMVDDAPALSLTADSAAGQIWRKLDQPIPPAVGRLTWNWRVDRAPSRSVLGDPDLDDAPARVFVVFGGGGLFGRSRVLFYTWGREERVEESFISYVSDRAAVIVLRNRHDPSGAWLEEERDPFVDFAEVFRREPDEIRAVGFMSDTEQTGEYAQAYLRQLRWSPGGRGTPSCSKHLGS